MTILAVALFATGFLLLFQVVYPATKHQRLVPQRVLVLDLATPASRQVVNAIRDRDFLVLRESSGVALPSATRAPSFVPTFKNFDYRVRDFVETSNVSAPLPRIFQPDRAPLPPLPAVASTPRPTELKPQNLRVSVINGLKQRILTQSPIINEAEAENFKVRIAVADDGRVTSAVPLDASQTQMALFAKLRPTLDRLRFAPASRTSVEWGTITFRWANGEGKP